ncbi:hypothetical protein PanWU01x14_082770, partial [Parasponia andersonii]
HHILILNIMFSIIFPYDKKKNLFTRKSRVCITTNMYKHTLLQPSSKKRTWHNLIFCRKFSMYKNRKNYVTRRVNLPFEIQCQSLRRNKKRWELCKGDVGQITPCSRICYSKRFYFPHHKELQPLCFNSCQYFKQNPFSIRLCSPSSIGLLSNVAP